MIDVSATANSNAPSIFVQIISYRDSETKQTISEVINKALNPQKLKVGVCYVWEETGLNWLEHPDLWAFPPNILSLERYNASDSKGKGWARSTCASLYDVQDFVLQIDSHTHLTQHWDKQLLSMWYQLQDEKAILSAAPNDYTYDAATKNIKLEQNTIKLLAPHYFGSEDGLLHCRSLTRRFSPVSFPKKPIATPFVSMNFVFGKAAYLKDVPHDPAIYDSGEEILYGARLWTHGYNIYVPNKTIMHQLPKKSLKAKEYYDPRNDCPDWEKLETKGITKVKQILSGDKRLKKYGLGTVRSLEQYQTFAGVNFKEKTIDKLASEGRFISVD